MENTDIQDPVKCASWPSSPLAWSTCSTPAGTESWWSKLPAHLANPNSSIYRSNNYVVLDFETSTLDKGFAGNERNRIHSAGWYQSKSTLPGCSGTVLHGKGSRGTYCYLRGGQYRLTSLLEALESCDFIVAHNAKFELQWLNRAGFDIASKPVWCTQIGDYVLAGNRGWKVSLNACLQRRGLPAKFDIMSKFWDLGVDTFDVPDSIVLSYLKQDVRSTVALFEKQREEIFEAGLDRVMFTRCLYVPVLADIELRGIKIDHDRASTIRLNLLKEKAKLEDEFTALIGGASYSSPQQVAKVLYDDLKFKEVLDWKGKEVRTATNLRKTDKPTIAKLQAKTKKQKEFVRIFTRLNEVSDALSKVVKHFHDSAEANELIHFNFNQTIAQTHRLTSSGKKYKVQGQNINNTYKPCVRARYDGWYIGERDSSGCEFRVATELGKDLLGLEHVNAGRDFHSYTASVIFGSSFETSEGYARKQLRTRAKPHTFKPLYGGQSGTPDERKYYEAFRELYRGISETQDTWVDTVLKTKQLRMINGLVFYWPNAKVLKSGYIYESTKIKNYPVQSIATADATSVATIYLWHAMRIEKMQSFLTLVVHDNTVGELHPDEKDKWLEIGDRCFKDVIYWYFYNVYDYSWVVPLDSEYDIQYHWSDNPEWQEKYLKIQ